MTSISCALGTVGTVDTVVTVDAVDTVDNENYCRHCRHCRHTINYIINNQKHPPPLKTTTHPSALAMADASAGDGKENEDPNFSPFELDYGGWFYDFLLEDSEENRNLGLGDAPTPPRIIAEFNSIIEDEGAKAGSFNHNAWHALFKDCKQAGVPDIRNKADRFMAVALMRHYFVINDQSAVEYQYSKISQYKYTISTSKLWELRPY